MERLERKTDGERINDMYDSKSSGDFGYLSSVKNARIRCKIMSVLMVEEYTRNFFRSLKKKEKNESQTKGLLNIKLPLLPHGKGFPE